MKQIVIIGLDAFGQRMVEELSEIEADLLIIDQDPELVEFYKDQVSSAYVANALKEEVIQRLVPPHIDAAIIDLGEKIEVSVLVTNYLKKMGVPRILVHASSDEHGEILELVGATEVIFPAREAARRITPILMSSEIFNFQPISSGLVMAEVKVPKEIIGQSLIEANFRTVHKLNVIGVKVSLEGEFDFVSGEYRFTGEELLLVVGKEEDLLSFSDIKSVNRKPLPGSGFLQRMFAKSRD